MAQHNTADDVNDLHGQDDDVRAVRSDGQTAARPATADEPAAN